MKLCHIVKHIVPAAILAFLLSLALHSAVSADTPIGGVPLLPVWGVEPVVDPFANRLYIVHTEARRVAVVDGNTATMFEVATPYSFYRALAIDPQNGRVYAATTGVSLSGKLTVTVLSTGGYVIDNYAFDINAGESIADMALSADNQELYIALEGSGGSYEDIIRAYALTGAFMHRISPTYGVASGIELAVEPVSGLLFYHYKMADETHRLFVWSPAYGGTTHVMALGYGRILFDGDDRRVYAGNLVLNADDGSLLAADFPKEARAINPHTNILYAVYDDGTMLSAINGKTYEEQLMWIGGNISAVGVAPHTQKVYVGMFYQSAYHVYLFDSGSHSSIDSISALDANDFTFNPFNHQVFVKSLYGMPPSGNTGVYLLDGAPTLNVSPGALTFSALAGSAPAQRRLYISSGYKDGSLAWTATSSRDWLLVDHPRGILSCGDGYCSDSLRVYINTEDLSPGVYNGAVHGHSSGAKNSPQTINVQLTIGDGRAPLLHVDGAQAARFVVMNGAVTPVSDTFTVRNLGRGVLDYTVVEALPWLTLTGPASGVADGAGVELEMQIDVAAAEALSPGLYTGVITVTSSAAGSPQWVNVTLDRRDPPTLAVSATRVVWNRFIEDGPPPPQTVRVSNTGGGGFTWDASSATSWVGVGGVTPNDFQVMADVSGLLPRHLPPYMGRVVVASPDDDVANNPTDVQVWLRLTTRRKMALSATRLDFAFREKTVVVPGQSFTIRNSGSSHPFDWTAEASAAWMVLGAASGTADAQGQSVSVRVDQWRLGPGVHEGTIIVRGAGVQGRVQTVRVIVTVTPKDAPICQANKGFDVLKAEGVNIRAHITEGTLQPNGHCAITGRLSINNLLGKQGTYPFTGELDATGLLVEAALPADARFALDVAGVTLSLTNLRVASGYLEADGAWSFSAFGGGNHSAGTVRFDAGGLSLSGGMTFALNQSLEVLGFSFHATQATLRQAATSGGYQLEVDGDLTIEIFDSRDVVVALTVVIDRNGARSKMGEVEFPIPGFSFTLAGLTLEAGSGKLSKRGVLIPTAQLRTPASFGGLAAAVHDVRINGVTGKVSIGGGEFRLPEIKAAGMTLMSLQGSLKERTGLRAMMLGSGYEISADGGFGLPGVLGSSGACAIDVGVTIYTNVLGNMVLALDEPETPDVTSGVCSANDVQAVNGLGLSRVKLGLKCHPGVPVGSTNLWITGVRGEIQFHGSIEMVSLGMTLEYGQPSILDINSDVTLYPSPFRLRAETDATLLRIITASSVVEVSKQGLGATMDVKFLILHGSSALYAGKYQGQYYLNGASSMAVEVEKGVIAKVIPPWDMTLFRIRMETGLFTNGHYGFKGQVEVLGWEPGVFVDITRKKVKWNVSRYTLVTPAAVSRARAAWDAVELGTLSPTHLDARFVFGPGDTLSIATPLATLAPTLNAPPLAVAPLSPDDSAIVTNVAGNVVFMLEQPAGGGLTLELVAPNGDHYTPINNRPDAYNEFEVDGARYIMYVENYASSGNWRANVKGNTASTPFTYTVLGATPPPYLTRTRLEQTGPLSATISWASAIYTGTQTHVVDLFATTGPVQRTLTYTDSNGVLQSETIPVYEGLQMAGGIDRLALSHTLDLSRLPSGDYYFWMQIDDGETTPKKAYFSEDGYSAPLTITVDHSASFTTTGWTTILTPVIDLRTGDGWFTWTPLAHPDVQTYTLALQGPAPLTPTLAITREATVVATDAMPGAWLDNLEPGTAYTLTIAADAGLGMWAWSQPCPFTTTQPDFIISATLDITVAAGSPVVVPLTLILAEDLPYDLAFDDLPAALPDGFALSFTPDVVTARGETTAAVTLSPLAEMYTGTYAVPLVAYSGALKREVVLTVTVTPYRSPVYLPLVMRNTP